MQTPITPQEQQSILVLTAGRGRKKWFLKETEISETPLDRMRKEAQADEVCVKKVRAFLKRRDVKALIAQKREAMAS